MSKKTFIYGFESLFGGPDEGMPQEETPVIALERSSEEGEKPKAKRRRRRRVTANAVGDNAQQDKRSSSKNFTSDLESLFMDALTDAFEEEEKAQPEVKRSKPDLPEVRKAQPVIEDKKPSNEGNTAPKKKVRKRRVVRSPRTRGGLDLLIRQTSEETYIEYQSENKRVTFVFDKKKLEKLKVIAKSKKLFLKDIIGDVVSKFIDEYENTDTDLF